MTNALPPLERLREHVAFSEDGVITLRKKVSTKDRRKVGQVLGTKTGLGYLKLKLFGVWYLAHRLVFFNHHGWCPDLIDHEDNNGSNNKPSNLRPASPAQNSIHRKHSKSRGAHWYKRDDRWVAQIKINGRGTHLGYFDTQDEAIAAYNEVAAKLHGTFFTR